MSLGCSEMRTNFADENPASRRILEKLGFTFERSGKGYVARLNLMKK